MHIEYWVDMLEQAGLSIGLQILQPNRTALLPNLYGELVSVMHLPSAEDMRGDPLAAMIAMEPLLAAIDASLADNAPLVIDAAGGPSASATLEYVGKTRLDAYLRKNGARVVVWLMFVADFAANSAPSNRITIVATSGWFWSLRRTDNESSIDNGGRSGGGVCSSGVC